MRRRDPYAPEPVEPRKPYDPDERLEFAAVARLCGRSLEWVESRAGAPGMPSILPGVLTRHSDGHRWIRRGDVCDWLRAAEAEDVQHRSSAPAPSEAYAKLPPLRVTGPVESVEWADLPW